MQEGELEPILGFHRVKRVSNVIVSFMSLSKARNKKTEEICPICMLRPFCIFPLSFHGKMQGGRSMHGGMKES